MRQWFVIASLGLGVFAITSALWLQTRLKATPTERWLARGIFLGAMGGVIGTAGNTFFPRIGIAASLVSVVFTAGSLVMLRHSRRRLRSTAHDARR